jgi:serine/threonine-protein kinase RsbW
VSVPYVALDLRIPSDIHQIEQVVETVSATCRSFHLTSRQRSLNIPVALSEALSNAILRGNRGDPSKSVRLRTLVLENALIFEVWDEGSGFDLRSSTHDPTELRNLYREDGRGLFLMQRLMDRVEQCRDNGNVVRLTLNLPAPQ